MKWNCCFVVLILFYLNASGHPSTGPHQTLQPCLQILLGGRKENPILHREVVQKLFAFFPPFFIHYLRHNKHKISRESQMEQNSPQHIPGCAFWIIYPQQSLWSRLGVYCTSLSMTVVKQYSQVWFSQLFFDARLLCPLISPLVSGCLCAQEKYNLTCNSFSEEPMTFFF